MEYSDLTSTVAVWVQREQSVFGLNQKIKMLRLLVCVMACWLALSMARPADPTPAETGIIPPVGSTPFPFGSPFLPGGANNPYYNNFKYDPNQPGPAVPILSYSNEHNPDGSYSFSFTTADGKQAQEAGYLKDAYIDNNGEPQGTQVVQGSYAYVSPEGTPIQVTYIADENGFRPSGVHIPADGKALPPLPAFADARNRSIFDPNYNRYNPYNRFGAYNPNRPYDSRYPYDPTRPHDARYPYDPTRPYDARYPYDPTRPYDARYPYDPRRPYDRFNPYNRFNPLRPAVAVANANANDSKEEAKKE